MIVEVKYKSATTIKHSETSAYNNFPKSAIIIPILYLSLIERNSKPAKMKMKAIIRGKSRKKMGKSFFKSMLYKS